MATLSASCFSLTSWLSDDIIAASEYIRVHLRRNYIAFKWNSSTININLSLISFSGWSFVGDQSPRSCALQPRNHTNMFSFRFFSFSRKSPQNEIEEVWTSPPPLPEGCSFKKGKSGRRTNNWSPFVGKTCSCYDFSVCGTWGLIILLRKNALMGGHRQEKSSPFLPLTNEIEIASSRRALQNFTLLM